MIDRLFNRRKLMTVGMVALLAGCAVVPRTTTPGEAPAPTPSPPPSSTVLPSDTARHRVALLVPLSGANAAVGQSIANAATMALLDTNAQNLRLTTYDTATGAAGAAARAIADDNKLILGPLLSDNIPAVAGAARPAKVPIISFSNDETAVGRDTFVMGSIPGQSVRRVVSYARSRGIENFGALVPLGEYGKRTSEALLSSVRSGGGSVVGMEAYDRSTASVRAAAGKLRQQGGYQAILIADGGRISSTAAPLVKTGSGPQLLGSELWSGDKAVTGSAALNGAWYAAVSDDRFAQFSKSYGSRFGGQPYRIATLGYDAVLLTLRVARDWKPGSVFPTGRMFDRGGFLGLDGAFRFAQDGVIERSLEVREVRSGGVRVISPAPGQFSD